MKNHSENKQLRASLRAIAAEVKPADLQQRALQTSRKLGVRRSAVLAASMATLIAVTAVGAAAWQDGRFTGVPPAAPPTPLPSWFEGGVPDLGAFDGADVVVPGWGDGERDCPTTIRLGRHTQYYPNLLGGISGSLSNTGGYLIGPHVTADLDGDGVPELIARVDCGQPESTVWQLVAFTLMDDVPVPMGRVIGSQDGMTTMGGLESRGSGQIAVQVANAEPPAFARETPIWTGILELIPSAWQTYEWRDGQFRQVDGPTRVPGKSLGDGQSVRLSVESATLTFRPDGDGYRADLRVVVRNSGNIGFNAGNLVMVLPEGVQPAGDSWSGCVRVAGLTCPVAGLGANSERTYQYGLRADSLPDPATGERVFPSPGPSEGYGASGHRVEIWQAWPYAYDESAWDRHGAWHPGADIEIVLP